jgi:hypothetical protein
MGDDELEPLEADDLIASEREYPGAEAPLDIDSVLLADIEPSEPTSTPVEITDEIFNSFKEDWGEDESASLVKHWGDNALANQSLARGLVEDHQEIQAALDNHLDNDKGLSTEGVQLVGEFIAERAGYSDMDSMVREHPEIGHIFNESYNKSTNALSASGALRVLHYVASRSGYSFKRNKA